MTHSARIAGGGTLLAALLLVGCQSGNKPLPARLTGKVTYNGTPVGGGVVTLYAENGQVYNAFLGTDGKFVFPDLPEGTLTATVDTESINPNKKTDEYRGGAKFPGAMYGKGGGGGGGAVAKGKGVMKPADPPGQVNTVEPVYVKIPAKYADKTKSGLTVTVKKGDQSHDFELTD